MQTNKTFNPITGIMLLTALAELLKLKRLDMNDAEAIDADDALIAIAEDYNKIMTNATKLGLEIVELYSKGHITMIGPDVNGIIKEVIEDKQLQLEFETDQFANNLIEDSKVVIAATKDGYTERMRIPLKNNLAEKAYSNIFKKNLGDTAEKKLLAPEDLFVNESESTPFLKTTLKSIISYLEEGKRGECVGFLVTYVFKHKGMTEIEAHKLLNDLKEYYGIIEKSKMRNVENKRNQNNAKSVELPKGVYLWAKYRTFKCKNWETPVEGIVLWPKESKNTTIVDGLGNFVGLNSNIIEYRLATRSEIDILVNKEREKDLKKSKEFYNSYLEYVESLKNK